LLLRLLLLEPPPLPLLPFLRVRMKLARKITLLISTQLTSEGQSDFETDVAPPNNNCTQQSKSLKEHTTIKSKVYMKYAYAIKQQWHAGPVTTVPTVLLPTVAAAAATGVNWLCRYQTA
jgi:hypothetical protein